jgi:hypothetical protein
MDEVKRNIFIEMGQIGSVHTCIHFAPPFTGHLVSQQLLAQLCMSRSCSGSPVHLIACHQVSIVCLLHWKHNYVSTMLQRNLQNNNLDVPNMTEQHS